MRPIVFATSSARGSDGGSFADHCPFAIEPMLGLTGIVGGTALYRVPDAALCTDLALKR